MSVGVPQRGVRWVVGVGLVSVSSVWFAAVCRVPSSAAPHGGLLWWCLGGGLWLGGSWEGPGSGWLGGGARVCGLACLPSAPPAVSSSAFPFFFLVHGGCPPASITQKRPNHGQVSVHGEPKFIEGQQPYVQ